eukprot:TRINITY_DN3442_c0_g1_i20.p1 TRINITY_DN3442_c0_g1~~TRINITY_DN3442_c0_g1_i20.p1  ORF type:complete len:333 (-),score=5.67 TRINITY_DN3442_c0_g1_i20:158-1156(-)
MIYLKFHLFHHLFYICIMKKYIEVIAIKNIYFINHVQIIINKSEKLNVLFVMINSKNQIETSFQCFDYIKANQNFVLERFFLVKMEEEKHTPEEKKQLREQGIIWDGDLLNIQELVSSSLADLTEAQKRRQLTKTEKKLKERWSIWDKSLMEQKRAKSQYNVRSHQLHAKSQLLPDTESDWDKVLREEAEREHLGIEHEGLALPRVSNTRIIMMPKGKSVKIRIVSKDELKNIQNEECPICMDKFGTQIIYKTSCKHNFHKECLLNWLKQNEKCPMCREQIVDLPLEDPFALYIPQIINHFFFFAKNGKSLLNYYIGYYNWYCRICNCRLLN